VIGILLLAARALEQEVEGLQYGFLAGAEQGLGFVFCRAGSEVGAVECGHGVQR